MNKFGQQTLWFSRSKLTQVFGTKDMGISQELCSLIREQPGFSITVRELREVGQKHLKQLQLSYLTKMGQRSNWLLETLGLS
jgi:hypothetical protein